MNACLVHSTVGLMVIITACTLAGAVFALLYSCGGRV
jgi:hypothetical protein